MRVSILTVFPELYEPFLNTSLVSRAQERGIVTFSVVGFSSFCQACQRIDEPICGPGAGMVIKPVLIEQAIEQVEKKWGRGYRIFFSCQGKKLDQKVLEHLVAQLTDALANGSNDDALPEQKTNHLILVASRYEGMDDRVERYYADEVISIGDYVLMGGDLPAQVLLEGLLRLLPGVVGKPESVEQESFSGPFLDYPTYGLPVEWREQRVPDIVLSGNHAAIDQWRQERACEKTIQNRFDWFASMQPSHAQRALAQQFIVPHYVALMHTQVKIKGGRVGETSVTSLDIHDIARSCMTYGVKNFFIVTPLIDQQELVKTFLQFWHSAEGKEYNRSRFQAVGTVRLADSLSAVIDCIKSQEGQRPVFLSTSARSFSDVCSIDYKSQKRVWGAQKPVLFLFGTGQGLSDEILEQSDFLLTPIQGLPDYNHLSVRSATAIVLDRWLGLHPKINKQSK